MVGQGDLQRDAEPNVNAQMLFAVGCCVGLAWDGGLVPYHRYIFLANSNWMDLRYRKTIGTC